MKRHRQTLLKPHGAHSWPVPEYLLPPAWSALRIDGALQTAAEAARASGAVQAESAHTTTPNLSSAA